MRLIGFDFTKISAERFGRQEREFSTSTDIDIVNISEEKTDFLKDSEVIKVSFALSVIYHEKEKKENKFGKIALEGDIIFSVEEKEAKELLNSWKKKENEKELPSAFKIPLFNIVLRKCIPKAIELEDTLGLPPHIPYPQIAAKSKEEKKDEKK